MEKAKQMIKKIFKKTNIIIACISLIIAFVSMINFSVSLYANNQRNICINFKAGDIIKDIVISSNSQNLESYQESKAKIEIIDDNKVELHILEDMSINMKISVIDNLSVLIERNDAHEEDTVTFYNIDGQEFQSNEKNVSVYSSNFEIIKNSLNTNSIFIFIISYVIILSCLFIINDTLKRIKENSLKIINIVLLLISIFILYLSCVYLLMMINKLLAILPAVLLSIYFLLFFNFSIKEWKNIFLLISAVVGVMMIFVITPGNVPDEPSHYVRSYVDSMGISDAEKDNVKLPKSVNQLFSKFAHGVQKLDIKYSGKSYMTEITRKADYYDFSDNRTNYENTRYLSFLPYLLPTILNFIGRNFKLPILIVFLICRLGNFIISTVLCYLAIKITPKFKKIFSILAILPIFLQQAVGIDMDYLTNAVVFLFIANIFKYRFLEELEIKLKDILILLVLQIAIGLCKFGYFPMLLLVLMIPTSKFKNKKAAIIFKVSLIILPVIISCMANFTAVSNPNQSNDKYTIGTVFSNPINSAIICIKTFILRLPVDTFVELINGFGWSTKYHSNVALWTLASIMIILLFIDNNEDSLEFKKKDRIIMLIAWALVYLILYGVAFTEWTSINSTTIMGLQSRYFFPVLPLFYIIISNDWITLNVKNKWKFYTVLLFIAELVSSASIIAAFYS